MKLCDRCDGSGEGRYDGTRCRACKGSGTATDEVDEAEERAYWDDRRYDEWKDNRFETPTTRG